MSRVTLPAEVWDQQIASLTAAPTDWLWHGFLAASCTTLLTSQWKSGKTTLLSMLLSRRFPTMDRKVERAGFRWVYPTILGAEVRRLPRCGWTGSGGRTPTWYFWLHFLGEKKRTFDFLVELVDAGPSTPFFLVQVRTTRKDYTRTQNPPRLRVEIAEEDIRQMVAFPAPTYVIGVHEREERAFFSVHEGMSATIPSITTAHELNGTTLLRLWEEVRGFWQGRDMRRTTSSFHNP